MAHSVEVFSVLNVAVLLSTIANCDSIAKDSCTPQTILFLHDTSVWMMQETCIT